MFGKIKKLFENLIFFFRAREMPESLALLSIILAGVLILTILIVIFWVVMPRVKVTIAISGPKEVKAGELATYTVTIKNTGNVILENPELIFNYSAHSLPEKGELVEKVGPEFFKNQIFPKQILNFQFKTRLFGQAGEEKEFKASLNYQPKGKKEIFTSPVAMTKTKISEVPIDLELDVASKIPVSTERKTGFKFRIRYFSLLDFTLQNLKIKVILPPNFTLTDSRPKVIEENQWPITSLGSNAAGTIEIWGEFPKGQELGKEISFGAQLYLLAHGQEILLKKIEKQSKTQEQVFFFSQKINGKEEYFPNPGERLHYEISFKNMSNQPQSNLVLTSVLEGNLFDLLTLTSPKGEFELGDNSITWTRNKVPELGYLRPGEEGKVDFWITLKPDYVPRDPGELNAILNNRIILLGFEEEFKTKVNSRVKIIQEGYFRDKYNFFVNSGSHPPEVNKTTTYSIIWKIENYYNQLKNVEVRATLAPQVKVKSLGPNLRVTGVESQPTSPYPDIPPGFKFENTLTQGMTSQEVKYLQIILKAEVPSAYSERTPVSGYFGSTTLKAVKAFQLKYRDEILTPQGLTQPSGIVDQYTRLKLNELLARGSVVTANEVVWSLPEIKPGAGVFSDSPIVGFQIALTPVIAQRGKVVPLIGEVVLVAKDQWTGESVSAKDDLIDTTLPDDPTVREFDQGKVR